MNYDPMDPPTEGIDADPLPEEIHEGDSGEVNDKNNAAPVFEGVNDG